MFNKIFGKMLETPILWIPAIQILAPITFMRWPAIFTNIKVKGVQRHEAQELTEVSLGLSGGKYTYDPPKHLPERTVITYDTQHGGGSFIINHESNTIDRTHTSLLHEPSGGSGEIGLVLIGLPGLLIASPLLILNGLMWKVIDWASGMDRYALNVYLKTMNQLDPVVREQFKQALKHN